MDHLDKGQAFALAQEIEELRATYALYLDRFTVQAGTYTVIMAVQRGGTLPFASRQEWLDWKEGVDATEEYRRQTEEPD